MIEILIPIYKEAPSADEDISLRQTFRVFGSRSIILVCPESLDIKKYHEYGSFETVRFPDRYFRDVHGYSELLLTAGFYQRFSAEYILICQPDAFVFRDDLEVWINSGYDYVGAPWLRSRDRIPLIKKMWDDTLEISRRLTHSGNSIAPKNKALLYNTVGNGGLSLRRRSACVDVLQKLAAVAAVYTAPENQNSFYAEDVFFSIEPARHQLPFFKPDFREACQFAIENKPARAMEINGNRLPMGCHNWPAERDYWRPYFLSLGYEI